MVCFFTAAYSQEKETPITETERIVDKYIDKTGEILSNLAEQLKVPAEHVYGVLVKQQKINGLTGIIAFVMGVFIFIISFITDKEDWEEFSFNKVMTVS